MICRSCLLRGISKPLTHPSRPSHQILRALSTSTSSTPAPSTPPSPSPPTLTTPLPNPLSASLGTPKSKPKTTVLPISSAPAGKILKGINYIQGRDDPVALKEEEYPEWLWRILDAKKDVDGKGEEEAGGDEFSKSKKLRRKAAKRQRKLEAALLASGDTSLFEPKIPLTQQSIDLPSNAEGTVEGAMDAVGAREEIRKAMRRERRQGIKTKNYLRSM
ncbi:hypothetical protein HYFRA_00012636 [Hymenoscyphus fraxineus]|uniref:Large ribosomal subunit protein mL54 n=1 Tax=Hymenoscyphus fraxineus TaxID=746836 RepID=A0A9N9L6B7_9HELO|nr:hypothetical protein HYFRA_00012636 [Hymenoscyphus fraxineus]